MPNHEHYDFHTLRNWMHFCREVQYASEAEFARALMCEAQSASPRWKEDGAPGPEEIMPSDPVYLESAEFSATLLRLVTCAHSCRARGSDEPWSSSSSWRSGVGFRRTVFEPTPAREFRSGWRGTPGCPAWMRSVDCSIDSRFPSAQTILALPGVDAGRLAVPVRRTPDRECLDRLLSLGCVHPFEKAVDEGVVLEGGFRAPLAHWMRIAPLASCCRAQLKQKSHGRSQSDPTGVTAIVG